MATGSVVEDIKTAAIVFGGIFFIYKFALGYLMINVTLKPTLRRQPLDESHDLIVVSAGVVKGDRECLQVNEIKVSVEGEGTHSFLTPALIKFATQEAPGGLLRLSPGEETSFEVALKVPKDQVTPINIVLRGWSGPISRRIPGYWRASLVSEPYFAKSK
ncbi:hypothetical protein [Azohydromonas australica]|uniref:hypothetical protein n=1 Tax=Azohydromonas australica TaxID=364039 RepID=UPI0012EC02C3|nr:hypothetical protein [Azohydromonas australica]